MRMLDVIYDANANLLRNKLRSFLTILAIFIGSFSIISTEKSVPSISAQLG